jgi:hypothetical protein
VKFIIAFALIFAIATVPALAGQNQRHVYNASHTCAWITIDTANAISKWSNQAYAYLKPGEGRTFTVASAPELKVRAEPTLHADCTGGKITDLNIVEKNGAGDLGNSETTLYTLHTIFHLKWGKP